MNAAWETKSLADVAELQGRIGWKGLTAKEYRPEGPYFLSVHSLNYGDFVDFRDAFHISQERYDESPEIMLRQDDVLICKDGAGIGKVGIVGELPGPSTINSSLLLLRAKSNILPKYLFLILQSPYFQDIVQSRLEGATTPHLYQRDIATFPVRLPPLEEQRRIVTALDEAFVAIATATANAERNLDNARELVEAEMRAAFSSPEPDWNWLTLREASLDFGRGKSKHRPRNDAKLYGGPYPFIQTGDVRSSDHFITEYSQTYSEAGLRQSKLWPRGTICITIAANIAETGILDFDACFPDSIIGMVVDPDKCSQHYAEYVLQSLKAVLQAKGKGSAQANINLATFENERFPFPPLSRQVEITQRLDEAANCARDLASIYERKIRELAELKQSLLHRAFSGELTGREPLAA